MTTLIRRRPAAAVAVLVLVAAMVAVAGVAASGLLGRAPAVVGAEQARDVAREWLREETGSTCFELATRDYYLPPTLAAADKLPSVDRWLNSGKIDAYVGSIEKADGLPVGATMSRAGEHASMTARDDGGPVIFSYQAVTTPKGRTVWLLKSTERAQPASGCE